MKLVILLGVICLQTYTIYAANEKVVCYWPNWRLYKKAPFHHTPEDIDPTLCTHIHYAFHILDEVHNVPKDSDGFPEVDAYKALNALKQNNTNLKIIVSLGGGGEKDEKYSHMISSLENRTSFIKNTIAYLHKYGFDGLDLDWEYPVCWGGNCNKGPKSDFENFAKLLQEAHTEFAKQNPKLSLSAAVVGGGVVAEKSYDMKALGTYLDYINIMTYDAAGTWDHQTGHHSEFKMCTDVLNWFHNKGIPKEKLLMGVPFYGHTFTLKDKTNHKIGAPITGQGHFPSDEGDNALYWEICDMVKNKNWTKEQAHNGHDPIAYHDDQWVGYDDPNQAYEKSKWVKENGFGGVIIWEITQDDWQMKCCTTNYPMLRAINYGLFGKGQNPSTYGCE